MPLKHFTERHIVRLLATETRRTDTPPHDLCGSHIALGRFLAGELVEDLPLEPREILHPQGVRSGWQVEDEAELTLVVLMRAGLYTAEGFREVLPNARVVHVSPRRGVGLGQRDLAGLGDLAGRRFVLVDSVVNTGKSMEPVLDQLRDAGAAWLAVAALVTPEPTATRLETAHIDVHFYFARTSTNQYVGKGNTDTGNRLFGTLPPRGAGAP
jgi:uracil phosphoribosyltransferase